MRGRALILYSLCCLLWGSTWLVIKIGLEDLSPFLFGGVRMSIASAALAPWAFRHGLPRLPPRQWFWVLAVGSLQLGLSYAAIFAAERFISSGLTAVLFCTFPIWVVGLAHLLLPDERLTALHLLSAVLGLLGIAVLQSPALTSVQLAPGVAVALFLPLVAAISSALGNVLQKRHLRGVPLSINLWTQTLVGAAVLLLMHFCLEPGVAVRWTPRALAALLYLAIPGTVVTFLSLFWLIPRLPMVVIGNIPILDTLIAVALGAAILREQIGGRLLLGSMLVLSGAALATRSRSPATETRVSGATQLDER
jgi:drug/metabolite transporter (DMT)-like permease